MFSSESEQGRFFFSYMRDRLSCSQSKVPATDLEFCGSFGCAQRVGHPASVGACICPLSVHYYKDLVVHGEEVPRSNLE